VEGRRRGGVRGLEGARGLEEDVEGARETGRGGWRIWRVGWRGKVDGR